MATKKTDTEQLGIFDRPTAVRRRKHAWTCSVCKEPCDIYLGSHPAGIKPTCERCLARAALEPMRALTLIQPWGTAILRWFKYLENRDWPPPAELLGKRFAIHAGKKLDDEDAWGLMELLPDATLENVLNVPRGVLLGTVVLHGYVAVQTGKSVGLSPLRTALMLKSKWRSPSARFLWHVGRPRLLAEPIPCRGYQTLWNVPAEHLPALRALEAP